MLKPTKVCIKCKVEKARADYYTRPNKNGENVWLSAECKACQSANRKHKYATDPEHKKKVLTDSRKRHLKKYGLTPEMYQEMLAKQDGECAICRSASTNRVRFNEENMLVDHCHKAGKVRQLLCHKCNMIIGLAKDNWCILNAAAHYVGYWNWRHGALEECVGPDDGEPELEKGWIGCA